MAWDRLTAAGVLGLAWLIPWMTWIPVTHWNSAIAVVQTPLWLFALGGLLALGGWIAREDGWLAVLVGYVVLRGLSASFPGTFEVVYLITLGCVMLLTVRKVPADWHPTIVVGLSIMAVAQAVYVLHQAAGFDLIWEGVTQGPARTLGTLGNENYVGVYLGMLAPVIALWALPAVILALILAHSSTGLLAASLGLLWKYAPGWVERAWPFLAAGILSVLAWATPLSLKVRALVWGAAVSDLTPWTWLVGHGWGAWMVRMPWLHPQRHENGDAIREYFLQAHNDWLQWVYEGGLLGGLILAGWLWHHRAALRTPWGPGMVAAGVTAMAMFPFHLAVPGLTALVLVGLATSQEAV